MTLEARTVIYPAGPSALPHGITRPRGAYRRRACIALLGLITFFALYVSIATWFAWMGCHLVWFAFNGAGSSWLAILIALGSFFLAAFMLRALFFLRIKQPNNGHEITPETQPQFFEFLNRLADEIGSRRPRRVFVTAQVGAAVSYDISLLNVLFPARRNLEIGLGLINVLSLLELKAVLAHEFGHFSQSTMLFGRWIYLSGQVAHYLVSNRDGFDAALRRMSSVVWLNPLGMLWLAVVCSVRICVWSIRELTDAGFRLFLAAQRAMSREMEFQADLVAVSVSGSEPLVSALHKLQGAEVALRNATAFALAERERGQRLPDLFDLQEVALQRLRVALALPEFGRAPESPETAREKHRVFKANWVRSPTMWATHPSCADREENCKRRYVPSVDPGVSAWCLFSQHEELRASVTAAALKLDGIPSRSRPESTSFYDRTFDRPALDRKYQGAYLRAAISRRAENIQELYGPEPEPGAVLNALDCLYPSSLSRDFETIKELSAEREFLHAVLNGGSLPMNGILSFRGAIISRSELPSVITKLDLELAEVETRIVDHDKACRAAHRAAAALVGPGWQPYVCGLVKILHYAEHGEANVRTAHQNLALVLAANTKAGRVSAKDLVPVVRVAELLYAAIREAFVLRPQVFIDVGLSRRLGFEHWPFRDLKFDLVAPTAKNLPLWLGVITGWFNACCEAFGQLRHGALDQLLETELLIARAATTHGVLLPAPVPSRVPPSFTRQTEAFGRPLAQQPAWLLRRQVLKGVLTRAGRFCAAGALIVSMSLLGLRAGTFIDSSAEFQKGLRAATAGDLGTAVKYYRQAAEHGNANAQNNLGIMYSNGAGIAQDYVTAFKLYQQAAEQNNPHAQVNVGAAYLAGRGVQKDDAKAYAWLRRAAHSGFAVAQRQVGLMTSQGIGTTADAASAATWLKQAADQGDAIAQNALGCAQLNGSGVEKDPARAFDWFKLAAKQKNPEAEYNVGKAYLQGVGVDQNYPEALRWLRLAGDQGESNALVLLGMAYSQGMGAEKDLAHGTALYLKSAERGNVNGESRAGIAYLYGYGIDKDYGKAITWLQKAAAQNAADAECQLGMIYVNGWGVAKNSTIAIEWFTKAAVQGSACAENELGRVYAEGMGVKRDPAQAVTWFRKGAEQGNAAAESNLALFYLRGEGVPLNKDMARDWLQKAVKQGFEPARTLLAKMNSR